MADTKISGLPAVATPEDSDEFAVNQSATSKKITRAKLLGRGQVVSALDYGATGDGTTDDTAAINAAIAAVNALSGQRTIWLPPASGGAYRITAALDPVDPGVNWRNDTRVKFEGTAGNFVVLQLGAESAVVSRARHLVEVVGNDVDAAGFTLIKIPNHIFSTIDIVRAEVATIAVDIRAFNGNAVWGTRIRLGDIRKNTVCLRIGADGADSWMNSNSIVGGAVEGHASAVADTIGIEFTNTNSAVSGEDNNVYDTSFQGLDFGVKSNVPTAVHIQSGRFESLAVAYDYSGSSSSPGDGPIVRPSFIWSVPDPLVQRSGGTDPYVSLPLSRTGRSLHWGGHPFEGTRAGTDTVASAMTAGDHSGTVLRTTDDVTVPQVAGFNVTLIAGGAHTVAFGSTTSAAMAAGDIMSIVVDDVPNIHAVLTAAADKVEFS